MGTHKITYNPVQRVEDLDMGMKTIINKFQFNFLYISHGNKSFPISEIQELNSNNIETVDKILELRSQKVRSKILKIGQKRKIFLLFGKEFTRVWFSFTHNKKKIIEKEMVCIYIPGLKFCPGLYEITKTFISNNDQNRLN